MNAVECHHISLHVATLSNRIGCSNIIEYDKIIIIIAICVILLQYCTLATIQQLFLHTPTFNLTDQAHRTLDHKDGSSLQKKLEEILSMLYQSYFFALI